LIIVAIEFFIGARNDHRIEDQAVGCEITVLILKLEGMNIDVRE
jgi:hypothetical protein